MSKQQNIIPRQKSGASNDTRAKIVLPSIAEAISHFKTVRSRLLNISGWEKLSNHKFASFRLTDPLGKELPGPPEKGNYIRINIPGPGSKTGEGFDWVQIENIEQNNNEGAYEFVAIRVRPAESPLNTKHTTAHFFKENATSTFIVKRNSNIIIAEVHGRNEKPNAEPRDLIDRARNIFVSLGAMLGFSKIQWKTLVKGLVKKSN